MGFQKLQTQITQIGLDHHKDSLLENARRNKPYILKTIREIPRNPAPCVVVSAGPSLHRNAILGRLQGFDGTIVAADGAYIQCLKAGITPDWVVTVDPHPTRIVRWFGKAVDDEYFKRQDLDITIREEQENLIGQVPVVIATTSAQSVVEATQDHYWFTPLVDDPEKPGITRTICGETQTPALTTGGTVGTAAWAFAHHVLGGDIALTGVDFGYYPDTPLKNTQEWNLLKHHEHVEEYYPMKQGFWGEAYTSPTYWWYRQNFLDLLEANDLRVTNCSEGGLLYGDRVNCMELEKWIASVS